MARHRQRCSVCGTEQTLNGGVCRKAACVSSARYADLSAGQIERLLAKRAAARRAGLLPRAQLEPWGRRGSPLETETFIRIRGGK